MSMSQALISSDSHVIEPNDLWVKRLPAAFRENAPSFPPLKVGTSFQHHDGGRDPAVRIKEMAVDGVSGEVLYASLLMELYSLTDAALQEACFRVYNDWLIEYCSVAPDRLFEIGAISTYNIDNAIKEMERCKRAGMRGVMIWQTPPDEIGFPTGHHERFWAAAQDMDMPVSQHILTGVPYQYGRAANAPKTELESITFRVNAKTMYTINSLSNIIVSGVLERFPRLKLVLVETEVSWLPFILGQWDKYCARKAYESRMKLLPSEYFKRQIFVTFLNDPPISVLFQEWGIDNCMWSNDFPHPNSTWPKSREIIQKNLGQLPEISRRKLMHDNVINLYKLPEIMPLAA